MFCYINKIYSAETEYISFYLDTVYLLLYSHKLKSLPSRASLPKNRRDALKLLTTWRFHPVYFNLLKPRNLKWMRKSNVFSLNSCVRSIDVVYTLHSSRHLKRNNPCEGTNPDENFWSTVALIKGDADSFPTIKFVFFFCLSRDVVMKNGSQVKPEWCLRWIFPSSINHVWTGSSANYNCRRP